MEITKTLYVTDAKDWRAWLSKNHNKEKEIWLIYYKVGSGKKRIPYNDAVEEAICFGWIDSTVKKIDGERFAQRFSPRNRKSPYSQMNRERLRKLISEGKVIKEVLSAVGNIQEEKFEIPREILKAIESNPKAWENFQKFSDRYKRIRIAYIDDARTSNRKSEFRKRLDYFIKMTARNKQFGFGGITEYF